MPVLAINSVTNSGFCSSYDIITFDQNSHNIYSSSAGGKDISNDTQIRVIGSTEPEVHEKAPRFQ